MKKIATLFIPKPFNFRTVKRRAIVILYVIIKFRHIVGFYSKVTKNNYLNTFKANPENAFKCFGYYLSRQFSIKQKIKIVQHHHLFMCTKFKDNFLDSLFLEGICLWNITTESGKHTISLSPSLNKKSFLEGELELAYKFNDSILYRFIFTIIPAQIIDKTNADYIFIGSSQGAKNSRDILTLCEKENNRIRPQSVLIIALQALASKTGISNIVGICAKNQVSLDFISNYSDFSFSYEDLWIRCGAEIQQENYILTNFPVIKDRAIKNNYRSRDKKQQLIRSEFYETIKNNLDQHLSSHI